MRFFPILRAAQFITGQIIIGLCAMVIGTGLATAQEMPAVDVALVLAVDASGSISPAEFQLQKEGIATAVTNEEVLSAITGGRHGRIAIAYVEWGGPGNATLGVDWMLVGSKTEADNFSATLLTAERSRQSYNALGDAIALGTALIADCPCQPKRRVIDVSGDNPDNRSVMPAPFARDAAVAAGITVNALAILNDGNLGPDGSPWLVENYQAHVIGGPASFVMPAASRADFARALRQKMILEISGITPDATQVAGD
jgi:hypothetical protein